MSRDRRLAAQDAWAVDLVTRPGSVFFARDQIAAVACCSPRRTTSPTSCVARWPAATPRRGARCSPPWAACGPSPATTPASSRRRRGRRAASPTGTRRTSRCSRRPRGRRACCSIHLSLASRSATPTACARRWQRGGTRGRLGRGRPRHVRRDDDDRDVVARVVDLAEAEPDPATRRCSLMWAAITAENVGRHAGRGCATPSARSTAAPATPYLEAALHSQLAQLAMCTGDHHLAAHHAELAWPVLMRLQAHDDANSMRFTSAISLLLDGDADGCRADARRGRRDDRRAARSGPGCCCTAARAELALARGDVRTGSTTTTGPGRGPGRGAGRPAILTPWLLIAASGALVAHVRHAPPGPDPRAGELRDILLGRAPAARRSAPLHRPAAQRRPAGRRRRAGRCGTATPRQRRRLAADGDRAPVGLQPLAALAGLGPLAALADEARPGGSARSGRSMPSGRAATSCRRRRGCSAVHIFRLKLRTDSGAKIAMTAAQPRSAQPTSAGHRAVVGEVAQAEMTRLTGLTSAKARSHDGMVSVGHERVGQEGQREHHHQRDALHALGASCRPCRTR